MTKGARRTAETLLERLARPRLGFAALLGTTAAVLLVGAAPGLAGAHPTGLFLAVILAGLALTGLGAAAVVGAGEDRELPPR